MKKPLDIREISWNDSGTCLYTTRHIDPQEFLSALIECKHLDCPLEARQALKVKDVQHVRFRPAFPYEFPDEWTITVTERGGYPVTMVEL